MNMPYQFIQMIKNGGNPQNILMSMIGNNSDPMSQNIITMMNNHDVKGIEQLARNICQTKGINIDELKTNIINQFK